LLAQTPLDRPEMGWRRRSALAAARWAVLSRSWDVVFDALLDGDRRRFAAASELGDIAS